MVSEICPNCSRNNCVSTSKLKFHLGLGLGQCQGQKCVFFKNKKIDMVSEMCPICSQNNSVSTSTLKFHFARVRVKNAYFWKIKKLKWSVKFAQTARETTTSLRRSSNFTQGQARISVKNAYFLKIQNIDMVSEICPNCSQNNHVSTSKLKFCLGLVLAQGQSQKCIFFEKSKI